MLGGRSLWTMTLRRMLTAVGGLGMMPHEQSQKDLGLGGQRRPLGWGAWGEEGACPRGGGVRPQEAPGPTSTSHERKCPSHVPSHLPEKRAPRAAFPEGFGNSHRALGTRRTGKRGDWR